jgi:hypothetical protein
LIGVWNFYFGLVGVNLGIILLGLLVLVLAIVKRLRGESTRLFELSSLLFLVGFLYFTLHGRLLQFVFPISVPEKPLFDNNLTFNYALTSLLTFMAFPVLLLILLGSDLSLRSFGLKVMDFKRTLLYAFLGLFFVVFLFLASHAFFGFRWISEYTFDGLVLWILFVTVFSVFAQTFFFVGILFNRYLDDESVLLLAVVSVSAFQMFVSAPPVWVVTNVLGSLAKIAVAWKTRSIYGAVLMGIATNSVDIFVQVL